MHAAIVIPCLNEQAVLASTCRSLGFGVEDAIPRAATLILVDNGSVDATQEVAKGIAAASPDGTVVVVNEVTRGFIPARHRGIIAAAAMTRQLGKADEEVLILQADADTSYGDHYVEAMTEAAVSAGSGVMLKGRTLFPDDFIQEFSDYLRLCDTVDAEFEYLLSDHPEDVVIDDKACGYLLSDYLRWGGHQREFAGNGDELHAETTRLYLRGKTHGARAALVDNATAVHSTRRIFEHAGMDLATSGFPRERTWLREWSRRLTAIADMNTLLLHRGNPSVEIALEWRRRHVLGLFGVLPLHVARTLEVYSKYESAEWVRSLSLPRRSVSALYSRPAMFVYDALKQAELIFGA